MDPKTTGSFIAAMRRERGMTQKQLAERLFLSEKTVSKWESGRGLPDVSTLLPLCRVLEIDLNELVVGHRIADEEYRESAEENLVKHLNKVTPRAKYAVTTISCLVTLLVGSFLCFFAGIADISDWQRLLHIAAAAVIFVSNIAVTLIVAGETEVYKCRFCGGRFVPAMHAYIFGAHTLTKRNLRCPHCHKKGWHRFSIDEK